MQTFIDIISNTGFFFTLLRLMTPILLAAISALIAQQAGITNMAIEGIMLFSALFAAVGAALTGNVWLGLLIGVVCGMLLGLALAFLKMKMKADEILVAIAINLLAAGATMFILFLITGDRSSSAALGMNSLPAVSIPILKDIPILGDILSGQNILVYVSLISVVVVHVFLYKTPLGLRIRAVGGNPNAAVSTGVSVAKTKYIALALSGVFAGLAGAYMSMGYMQVFTKNMVAGRGFIALAAANVGGMTPIGSLFAALLFGFCDALGNGLQTTGLPAELIYMLPYIVTILAYSAFTYRKSRKKRRVHKHENAQVTS